MGILKLLDDWKARNGEGCCYHFSVDTVGLSKYKLSLYSMSDRSEIIGAFSLSTDNFQEIINKLQKGINENENDK